jgi:general secretion pathway protein G
MRLKMGQAKTRRSGVDLMKPAVSLSALSSSTHLSPMQNTRFTPAVRRAGFTLMEMMLVLGIIGILVTVTTMSLSGVMEDAKVTKAKTGIRDLNIHMLSFRTNSGGLLPTQLEGLVTKPSGLGKKPWRQYAKENELIDPWGSPYVYRNPGKQNSTGFDLFSVGPDKKEGTDDDIWPE